MAKKSRAELDFQLRAKRIDRVADLLGLLIRFGSLTLCVWIGGQAAMSYAGETTVADVGINVIGDFRISEWVAALFGGGGVMYGMREKRLRRNTIESMSGRIKSLESIHDPRRTSSMLTERGTTRPEDKRQR